MKKYRLFYLKGFLFIFLFLIIAQYFEPVALGNLLPEYIENQYIVVLEDEVDSEVVGMQMTDAYSSYGFELGNVYQYAIKGFSAKIPEEIYDDVFLDSRVKYIEQDKKGYYFDYLPNILQYCQFVPNGIRRIGADLNIGGKGKEIDVDIAILDSGIDLDHPDLNVVENVSFVSWIASGEDDYGHGTHVAGIAAARDNRIGVVGVAPGARLHALKVGTQYGVAMGWLIDGVDWVASKADVIEVANMSLGFMGYTQALRDAIKKCINQGVVFVVAAGNANMDIYGNDGIFGTIDDCEPASYPEVATISAMVDSDGRCGGKGHNLDKNSFNVYGGLYTEYTNFDDTIATLSNYSDDVVPENPVSSSGKAIDLAAPGISVLSTDINGWYSLKDGTSMAAPHVTGAVALYISEHYRAYNANDVYEIRQYLIDMAEPQKDDPQMNCLGWGPADTKDKDEFPEGLINLRVDPLTLKIVNPQSKAKLTKNQNVTIQVKANYNDWMNKVTYSVNNEDYLDMNFIENTGYWEARWNINKLEVGYYTITVSGEDRMGGEASDSIKVSIKDPPPPPPLQPGPYPYGVRGPYPYGVRGPYPYGVWGLYPYGGWWPYQPGGIWRPDQYPIGTQLPTITWRPDQYPIGTQLPTITWRPDLYPIGTQLPTITWRPDQFSLTF